MRNPFDPRPPKPFQVQLGFAVEGFKLLEEFDWFKIEMLEEVVVWEQEIRMLKTKLYIATISFGKHQLYALVPREWTKTFVKELGRKQVKKALDKVSDLSFKDRIFWHWSKTCRLLKRALIDNVELEIATLLSGDKTEE